ncbi:dnaJ homolog subfamily C member 30, mitochondrial-like [Aplochiton taeniatus]
MHPQIAFYPLLASAQPSPHVNFMGRRMRCLSNKDIVKATTFHPVPFGSPQQTRGFSTIIITVSTQKSEGGGPRFRWSTCISQVFQPSTSTTRSYCWGGNDTTSDTSHRYRSKTLYYDILRVTPHATQTQIKTAYYKQSFIYHPDKNPDNKEAGERFAEISVAYSVLGSIGLRRKYDCGILSESDVHGAGRPSARDTTFSKPHAAQQQQQPRFRRYTHVGGKTATFDFDAFYQAHYGEQLRREREIKARKERLQEKQKEDYRKWKEGKMMEVTVAVLLAAGGIILLSFSRS